MRLMHFVFFAGGVCALYGLYVAAVLVWWWGVSRRQNRRFNQVRGRLLVGGLVRSGGLR